MGSGGARSGLASHRVAPAVLSGAAAGHDRVRDGTGWGHRALGHGHPPTPNVCPVEVRAHRTERVAFRTYLGWLRHACAPVVLPSRAGGRRASWFPAGPYRSPRLGNGARSVARVKSLPSIIRTRQLRSVTRRPPRAYQPGRLPGILPALAVGYVVLGKDSRLDAFSGSPVRTWLLSDARCQTTDPPAVRPTRSSRTRVSVPHVSNAHGG